MWQSSKVLPVELVQRLYFRRQYDQVLSKQIKRTTGSVPLGKEVAVYLIFPSSGLLRSHLYMIDQLRKAGISPIVVSNLPLSPEAVDSIRPHVSLIIERPNIGYDFGGYRDGILEIAPRLPNLDRLWIVNDSVWLMPQTTSWFEQARKLDKDLVAATSNFAILRKSLFGARRVNASDYLSISWNHNPRNPNFHYASYALGIGPAILKDDGFLTYWKMLEIRNDKKHTVRRGEIGLTQWVLKHGYSHAATHDIHDLDRELTKLPNAVLDMAAQELVIFKGSRLAGIKHHVLSTDPNSEEGRFERICLILTAVARQSSAYALALYNLRQHQFQFLKKSPLWLSAQGPAAIRHYLDALNSDEGKYIASEARGICKDREQL